VIADGTQMVGGHLAGQRRRTIGLAGVDTVAEARDKTGADCQADLVQPTVQRTRSAKPRCEIPLMSHPKEIPVLRHGAG